MDLALRLFMSTNPLIIHIEKYHMANSLDSLQSLSADDICLKKQKMEK